MSLMKAVDIHGQPNNKIWTIIQAVLLAGMILFAGLFVLFQCKSNFKIPLVTQSGPAYWITEARDFTPFFVRMDKRKIPRSYFIRNFSAEIGKPLLIEIKAMSKFRLSINRKLVASKEEGNWKDAVTIDISSAVRQGRNQMEVIVWNDYGNTLLWIDHEEGSLDIRTDQRWKVKSSLDNITKNAVIGDDRVFHPDSKKLPLPRASLTERYKKIITIFVVWSILFALGLGLLRDFSAYLPRIALGISVVIWIIFFSGNIFSIPADVGFDAPAHIEYIQFLLTEGKLPLASQGWEMFQPPLFYALAATLVKVLGSNVVNAETLSLAKILPFLCGVGQIFMAFLCGRIRFKDDPKARAFMIFLVALAPMNIYMAAYLSNEPLFALLISAAFCVITSLLMIERKSQTPLVLGLAFIMSFALLSKYTALVFVPVLALSLIVFWSLAGKHSSKRMVCQLTLLISVIAVLSAWWYIRNIIHYGDPVIANWDFFAEKGLWWFPGFRTPAYFLSFGDVFKFPFYSGSASFWDGLYSTLWGDGYLGGKAWMAGRHLFWSYHWMSITYVLAIPATAILFIGFFVSLSKSLMGSHMRRRWLDYTFCGIFVLFLAILIFNSLNVRHGGWGNAKSFFGLSLLLPLAIFAVNGTMIIDHRLSGRAWLRPLRALFWAYWGTFFTVIILTYG